MGLLVGQRSGLHALGSFGLLVRHSQDVGTALHNLAAHLHVRDRGAVASLRVSCGTASLGYEIYQANVEGADQICDAAIAIAMNIMRALCGRGWRPSEVLFSHREPTDPRPFRIAFDAPARFDSDRTALVFPARWLAHRIRGAGPVLFREVASRIEVLESRNSSDFLAEVRRMLRWMLLGGKGSVDDVASRLSMHRRTLNRRLRASGTTLHRLVEEIRFEIARQLVADTRMPLTEVAAVLGYAEPSAFTRAFRRWTGSAPSTWRNGRLRAPVELPPRVAGPRSVSTFRPSRPSSGRAPEAASGPVDVATRPS